MPYFEEPDELSEDDEPKEPIESNALAMLELPPFRATKSSHQLSEESAFQFFSERKQKQNADLEDVFEKPSPAKSPPFKRESFKA